MTYGHGPTWLAERDTWLTTARAELAADHGYVPTSEESTHG